MKNFWSVVFIATVFQSLILSVLAGGHHGHGSNLAHILAAGLIVQLLSRSHHHHHGHEGRSVDDDIHSEYSPYASASSWAQDPRMTPESTLASSSWAQRTPIDIAYSQSQYNEPLMESYNVPFFYQPPHTHTVTTGIW